VRLKQRASSEADRQKEEQESDDEEESRVFNLLTSSSENFGPDSPTSYKRHRSSSSKGSGGLKPPPLETVPLSLLCCHSAAALPWEALLQTELAVVRGLCLTSLCSQVLGRREGPDGPAGCSRLHLGPQLVSPALCSMLYALCCCCCHSRCPVVTCY
jgi:hypothetical protein